MWCDRTTSADPVRYTAATMEIMRLEDLHHIKCGVNYAADHSHGHLSNAISSEYFAAKEWAVKDQKRDERMQQVWNADPDKTLRRLRRKAARSVYPPYAWDGPQGYWHKETSCMAFINSKGKKQTALQGIQVEGSHPIVTKSPAKRRDLLQAPNGSYIHSGLLGQAVIGGPGAMKTRPKTAGPARSSASSFLDQSDINHCVDRVTQKIMEISSSAGSSVGKRPSTSGSTAVSRSGSRAVSRAGSKP